MSLKKTETGEDNKVISLEEAARNLEGKAGPTFSKGLYEWIMFVISFYSRVRETLKIDFDTMETNLQGVFAAGDITRGASLVVWAIKDGRDAALSIEKYLKTKSLQKTEAA